MKSGMDNTVIIMKKHTLLLCLCGGYFVACATSIWSLFGERVRVNTSVTVSSSFGIYPTLSSHEIGASENVFSEDDFAVYRTENNITVYMDAASPIEIERNVTTTTTTVVHVDDPAQIIKRIASSGFKSTMDIDRTILTTPTPEQKKQQRLIIHVGPEKTGTSTVQEYLGKQRHVLQDDNIYFLGQSWEIPELNLHNTIGRCRSCEDSKGSCAADCKRYWQEFGKVLEKHRMLGHSVLISEELLTGFWSQKQEIELLWQNFLPLLKEWETRVIYTYRRYFEWVPSRYHQKFDFYWALEKDKKFTKWPEEGGLMIPSFPEYFQRFYNKGFEQPSSNFKRIKKQLEGASKTANPVWVFNMHAFPKDQFLRKFVCNMIPEAQTLCGVLRSDSIDDGDELGEARELNAAAMVSNPSSVKENFVHFDRLILGAWRKGFIRKKSKINRVDARQAAIDFAKAEGLDIRAGDFPLECLDRGRTSDILRKSLAEEQIMVPKFFQSENGKSGLYTDFARISASRTKFCSVDVKRILQDRQWRRFFARLGSED